MSGIKAIETLFDGHRFRSRLEARWAVFFKEAYIDYEYEPEGFEVGGGVRYLPDFYLPELKLHVEVKPNTELSRGDLERIIRFAVDCDQLLLLILGTPGAEAMYLVNRATADSWESFLAAELNLTDAELLESFYESVTEWNHVEFGAVPLLPGYRLIYKTKPPLADATVTMALAKARQARFEHGRRGN